MDKRLINRELSKWLIQGNGEVKVEGSEWVYTEMWQDRCHPLGWLCELPHYP